MNLGTHQPGTHLTYLANFAAWAVWHIGLLSLLVVAPAACLWGQTGKDAASPFDALNASLEQRVNQELLSVTHPIVQARSKPFSAPQVHPPIRNSSPSSRSTTTTALSRIAALRPVLGPILREFGIPTRFEAVVLVESGGDPLALSPKGARGLWQLMPGTARRYGLIVDRTEDDRIDIEKSTIAAAQYLRDLHSEFGSWPLALAAYNTGEQNVQSAIARSRSTNFNVLSSLRLLPLETRSYVPRVMAAATGLSSSSAVYRLPSQAGQNTWTVYAAAERGN